MVDAEQVGGYLTTIDYTETQNTGTEWRSHLAEAICQPGNEQLPYRFFLPTPSTLSRPAFGHEEAVSFVLRVKDLSFTQPFVGVGTFDAPKRKMRLADETECGSPGRPCQHDYLEISAKLPASSVPHLTDGSSALLPVARFCLIEDQRTNPVRDESSMIDSTWIGRTFGPLPAATGLQFMSNLNLLDANVIPGKGVLIEYIALFCTPINAPSGYGVVDYRFQTLPQSSHTIAYVEIFCPTNRWLEPQQPRQAEANMNEQTGQSWWLERQQHTTRICDHHSRTWSPDRIPEACLTESELEAFVVKIQSRIEQEQIASSRYGTSSTPSHNVLPDHNNSLLNVTHKELQNEENTLSNSSEKIVLTSVGRTGRQEEPAEGQKIHAGTSIAVGAAVGFILCLLAVVLIVYSLRHRLVAQYHKNVTYPLPDRLSRSCSTFTPSIHSYYPTMNSVDIRRKWNKSKWDLFRSWHVTPCSQNLSGTYPDLPRQTAFHGSLTAGSRTPDTILAGKLNPAWRTQINRSGLSSFSLAPGCPNATSGFDNNISVNTSPWLRTNSTTRLGTKPQFFASSGELISPIDGQLQVPRSWWLPWRRSFRRQRRLYTQLQRRKEVLYQSQRRLMESSLMSNSSSVQFSQPPSVRLPATPTMPQPNQPAEQIPNGQIHDHPLSQHTMRSKILTTSDGVAHSTSNGILDLRRDSGFVSPYPPPFPNGISFPQFNYTNMDPVTGCMMTTRAPAYPGTAEPVDITSAGDEQLPWKTPTGNSISQGFRRLSSFLRTLNGSLTPPRSNRQSQQLIHQIHPQSMSTLNSAHYFPVCSNDANAMMGPITGFPPTSMTNSPRPRSESGSIRPNRIGLLRNLFHIPNPRGDATASMYNLDGEDSSTFGDVTSGSVTTKTSRVGSTVNTSPACGPVDYWTQCPDPSHTISTASTVRAQSPPTVRLQHGHRSAATRAPCLTNGTQPGANRNATNSNDMPPHSNDPYLVPSSVKRLRGEMGRMAILKPAKTTHVSETDPLPSGTSSAISSQVFAESVEDEHEVPDMIDMRSSSNHLGHNSTTDEGAPSRPQSLLDQGAAGDRQWSEAAVIDYVMYDETRSLGNTLALDETKPITIPKGELLSTQVGNSPETVRNLKRKHSKGKVNPESRPLSEAMISNHYYDGNGHLQDYPEPTEPAPPLPNLPPRLNPPTSRLHPPLPPLWTQTSTGAVSFSRTAVPHSLAPFYRDEYGSMDSLYETVDQFKPINNRTPSQEQALKTTLSSSGLTIPFAQECSAERQKLALPPTPDSLESLRAPVASSDEETDGA
ncbi:uncharacterized protein DEA37_0009275 [Paragonimus westermani]|uniref:Uncharacterized protein n=1 Tax=Paragonimus westermani TaxID=34504 RepID=A0A5J4NSL0_9TREM|nr:uncharacterized protein DEA37_0009275 [Paragonimus westermani]